MKPAVEVRGLRKSYGGRAVLKGIDLRVEAGEIFALLGVNGAGKTTALECIEGLRAYDGGTVEVNGRRGIQLQSSSLPSHIRPMEAVRLFAQWNRTEIDGSMLEELGIRDMGKKLYAQLSTGQKRRLHLALALAGRPDILFLDEPTAGLDVEGRRSLHSLIRRLKAQGRTIILASHDMAEVEALCGRIAILNDGAVAFCGTALALTDRLGKRYVIHIQTSRGSETAETDDIGETLLSRLGELKRAGIGIQDIRVDRGTLEQHFIELAGGKRK